MQGRRSRNLSVRVVTLTLAWSLATVAQTPSSGLSVARELMARPRKQVDTIEILRLRLAGRSLREIASELRLGRGTAHGNN